MKQLRFSLLGLAAVLIAIGSLNYVGLFDTRIAPDPSDPALVNLGQVVYAEHCASCHGDKLQGAENWQTRNADGTLPAPPQDARGHNWHHADDVLLQIISGGGQSFMPKGGKSMMPGFQDKISAREIAGVLAFIKSRWPHEILDRQQKTSGHSHKN